MSRTTVYALVNQKGGTGKTQSTENIGIGLAQEGKKVLLVDLDPQGSLTISMGFPKTDDIPITVTDILSNVIQEIPLEHGDGIIHHREGVDLLPANISLAGLEVSLVNVMGRERILKEYLDSVKKDYDAVLIDCMPSLGMLTVNALAAADKLIIPVQSQYLSAKGLEQLLQTVSRVKRQMNPGLKIDGILLTMVDSRTNYAREISDLVRNVYGKKINIYDTEIPHSVRAAEISAAGKSIYEHDPKGKVAEAYKKLTKEVLKNAEISRKHTAFEL